MLILSQLLVTLFGGVDHLLHSAPLYEVLGLSRRGMGQGQVWQLVTHPFLHGSGMHFLLNFLMIYLLGGRISHILGDAAFLKIFAGGVLVGSALHLLLQPAVPTASAAAAGIRDLPLVGASAGAMALLLALTNLSPDSRMWPLPVSGKNLGRGLLLAALILFLVTPGTGVPVLSSIGLWLEREAGMVSLFHVGHIYHFGGGLAGWWYTRRLLLAPVNLEQLRRARARRDGSGETAA
jgi:membrane associated rhomboid family serine protease